MKKLFGFVLFGMYSLLFKSYAVSTEVGATTGIDLSWIKESEWSYRLVFENKSENDVLIGDTIFNLDWHAEFPLGVTVYFHSCEGKLHGVVNMSNYDLGWNPEINPSKAYLPTDYIRLVKSGYRLERVIDLKTLLDDFVRARGSSADEPERGSFVFVARIATIAFGDNVSWSELDVIVKKLEVRGSFSPKPPLYD